MLYTSLTGPTPACHILEKLKHIPKPSFNLAAHSWKGINLLVSAVSVGKYFWIPVQVKDVVEIENGLIIDPEYSVIEHGSTFRIEIQGRFHFRSPVEGVQL